MKKIIFIVIIVLVVAVLGVAARRLGNGPSSAPAPSSSSDVNRPVGGNERFAGFLLKDYAGNTVASDAFRGTLLVINSWASWCPFCRQELPDLAAAQQEFGDKVKVVAIDRSEPLATAKKYSDWLGVSGTLVFLIDPSDSFYQSIGGFSMPETIFVDKNGLIVIHKRGPMDINEIREKIQGLL